VAADVDGGELHVLEGGTATIAEGHPVFILEYRLDS